MGSPSGTEYGHSTGKWKPGDFQEVSVGQREMREKKCVNERMYTLKRGRKIEDESKERRRGKE